MSVGQGARLYAGKPIPDGMTKSAFKKQLKMDKMEAGKEEFLEKRRAKRRLQRNKQRRPKRSDEQSPSGVNIILDCNFDSLMEEGERTSLAGQLTRCYSENRKCKHPVDLTISGFNGRLKDRFENEMRRTHELWKNITFLEDDFVVSDDQKDKIIYLTGDAEESLSELEPEMTYVVGGIVDKNRYKDLCLNKAKEMGIKVAKLPIDDHIRVSGRRVLTTNQAFELLLRWLELRDWKAAFETAIPQRKLGGEEAEVESKEEANAETNSSVGLGNENI